MEKTYHRGREAMRNAYAEPTDRRFHEWRKRVKYHCDHCRLLRQLWPALMEARAREAKRLANILGDDHDLTVFCELLRTDPGLCVTPGRRQAILELADRHRKTLRKQARALGLLLFATKSKALRKQFKRYTAAWRA